MQRYRWNGKVECTAGRKVTQETKYAHRASETDPQTWRRYLRHEFREAAAASEQALAYASRE